MTTIRENLAALPERKALVRAVLGPNLRGKRDKTLVSAYKRLKPGSDGRIHTGLSVATTSGRLASSNTITEESGTNLQNLSNKIATLDQLYHTRDILRADRGFHLITRDFSSAEALLCFAYAEDWEWVEILRRGESMHGLHAKEFFGLTCPADQVKKLYPETYTTSKNLTFLSLYLGGARTATVTFNKDFPIHGQRITEREVARIQGILYELHTLKEWWANVEDQLERDKGTIINCFGQARPLRDPDKHSRLKDALSYLPQSTVAWLMNQAVVRVHDELDKAEEIELLHQVHDEICLQSRPEHVDRTLAATKRIMETTFVVRGKRIHIPTEAGMGPLSGSWGQVEKVKGVLRQQESPKSFES